FSDGERLRVIRKAKSKGYFVEHCNLQMHAADRYEIHTSKQMRQGRPLVGMLLKSIDELGGLPTSYIPPEETPACRHYWEQAYGVFLQDASDRQGQVTVNKRLVGYIRLLRYGEMACYVPIVGHGSHLVHGIMDLCHHHILKVLLDDR